jgi:hypothetical protein
MSRQLADGRDHRVCRGSGLSRPFGLPTAWSTITILQTELGIQMRDYDGVAYRFVDGDQKNEQAVRLVSDILGFTPNTKALKYELNLYAGGIGVDDKLAFCFEASDEEVRSVALKLSLVIPTVALSEVGWGEDFAWLIDKDGNGEPVIEKSVMFINQNRKLFQSECSSTCHIFFSRESNVNNWSSVWICAGTLNYLSFDQG